MERSFSIGLGLGVIDKDLVLDERNSICAPCCCSSLVSASWLL